jgi:hypothetical protein
MATSYTSGSNSTVYTTVTSNLTTSGNITLSGSLGSWNGATWGVPPAKLAIAGEKPTIKLDEGEIDLKLLLTMMKQMQSILCIIEEDIKQHEKYPALKDLYDQFRVVEAMVKADEDDGED